MYFTFDSIFFHSDSVQFLFCLASLCYISTINIDIAGFDDRHEFKGEGFIFMLHFHFLIFFQIQSRFDRFMKNNGKGTIRLDIPIFQNGGGRLISV